MLKGVNRNVLVVRVDKNSRFESVYFVMKKGRSLERADIIKEANGIISKSGITSSSSNVWKYATVGFFTGTVCGCVLTAFIWVLSVLFE